MMPLLELVIGNLLLATLIAVIALWVGRRGKRAALAHALWILVLVKLVTPPIISLPVPIPLPAQASASTKTTSQTQTSLQDGSGENVQRIANPSGETLPRPSQKTNRSEILASEIPDRGNLASHPDDDASSSEAFSSADRDAFQTSYAAMVTNSPSSLSEYFDSFGAKLTGWLVTVWGIGFLLMASRGLVRLIRFRKLITECGHDDEAAAEIVQQFSCRRLSSRWGSKPPRVVRMDVHVSPMLFGFATRPIIVCPEDLWQAMSDEDRRAFLAHETAHYCRRDHWVRWLEWFVTSAYWWFPGVYFAKQQLERHEEACCDARAVELLETKPRRYAEALLRVVDFISEHQIGLPKFASGMQPTATLEERLRLLMRQEGNAPASRSVRMVCGVMCSVIIILHPQLYLMPLGERPDLASHWSVAPPSFSQVIEQTPKAQMQAAEIEAALPPAPSGFWNLQPAQRWASFTLKTSGYRLRAVTDRGISIVGERTHLSFQQDELTAISEVSSTGRVIIGDTDGNVRLWDLDASMAVSLLGSHQNEVTSVCVGNDGGVFSADAVGSVIRWEMQSGQMIARWTSDGDPIQSIRMSDDGTYLAVVCGDWQNQRVAPTLHLLNAQTLSHHGQQMLPAGAALVQQDSLNRWCVICWDGTVLDLFSESSRGSIDKIQVSALLLSQHAEFEIERSQVMQSPLFE
ncbi:M56 family metallopeptidase [Rhodopirellula sp. MGV]|uniref:M56 family metallopeptidase n=1 Tax=Rhodopirellula sp. MGV TaxID=2023130 RepID=UPI000B97842D|nr:M56 family metallopeptidase [Rhodopirellula sp. MGV]OYP29369.1 hypothetical protein CGZ80_24475 [Rhodopirellula sp. MGV]PNY35675.1 hypothetical protein C2E31_16430 [Rhodopirellula baltica]